MHRFDSLETIFSNNKEEKLPIVKNPYSHEILETFLLRGINLEPSQALSTQPLLDQVQTQSDLIECCVPGCFIKCKKECMRQHIGQNLINNQIADDRETCR